MNLPPLSLHHLHGLTDATGIIQHARLSIPDRHSGYTGDDNSRALVLAVHLQALRPRARADPACLEASDHPRVRQRAAGSGTPADACDVTAYLADRPMAAYRRSADREGRFS